MIQRLRDEIGGSARWADTLVPPKTAPPPSNQLKYANTNTTACQFAIDHDISYLFFGLTVCVESISVTQNYNRLGTPTTSASKPIVTVLNAGVMHLPPALHGFCVTPALLVASDRSIMCAVDDTPL